MSQKVGPDVTLISMMMHKSNRAHFYCKTVMGLHRIDELYMTRQLGTVLQEVIVGFADGSQQLPLSHLVWEAADYIRCTRNFHQQQGLCW